FRDYLNLTMLSPLPERCSLLVSETIGGNVVRAERQCRRKVGFPFTTCLAGHAKDQIEGNVIDAAPNSLKCRGDVVWRMDSVKFRQHSGGKRLYAQTDARHPVVAQGRHLVFGDALWSSLDRELSARAEWQPTRD